MSDYAELIKNLRSVKDTWQTQEEEWMLQAADAIEKLMALPAVELPMSAVEYLKERTRMEVWCAENCNQASFDCDDWCCECPYDQVPSCADEAKRPLEAIAIVEKWAQEHPEEANNADQKRKL